MVGTFFFSEGEISYKWQKVFFPDFVLQHDDGIDAIVKTTVKNGWAGVDFDDECKMNIANIIETMKRLKAAGKETSYTFLAGWAYNNKPDDLDTIVKTLL